MSIIKEIEQWQKDRLLDKQEFDDINEFANIVEELYELVGIKIPKQIRMDFKKDIKEAINRIKKDKRYLVDIYSPTDEDKIDALFDICVFAIGGMLKLGYNPKCVFKEGIKHINSRTGSIVDGKFQKDVNVKTYEPQYNKCRKDKK